MLLLILSSVNALIYTIVASGLIIAYFNFKDLKALFARKKKPADESIDELTKETVEEHISLWH